MHGTGEVGVASNGTQDTEKFAADPNITGETMVITVISVILHRGSSGCTAEIA